MKKDICTYIFSFSTSKKIKFLFNNDYNLAFSCCLLNTMKLFGKNI